MKFGVYEKLGAIVALYECGMMAKTIHQVLKLLSVNVGAEHIASYRQLFLSITR